MTDSSQLNTFANEVARVLNDPAIAKELKYKWRCIRAIKVPERLPRVMLDLLNETKPASESYTQEDQLIDFRQRFSQSWRQIPKEDVETRTKMLTWVVRNWGEINRSLKPETLRAYAEKFDTSWMTNLRNISSKSKCLAFVNPDERFVYDSRVAMALNTILINKFPYYDWCFRVGAGASRDFLLFNHNLLKGKKSIKYDDYCRFIRDVALKMSPALTGSYVQSIEFKLFALGQNIEKARNNL